MKLDKKLDTAFYQLLRYGPTKAVLVIPALKQVEVIKQDRNGTRSEKIGYSHPQYLHTDKRKRLHKWLKNIE